MDTNVSKKLHEFFTNFPLKRFKRGQILIYGGDSPPGIYFIQSGEVRQYDIARNGDEMVVNVYNPPSLFPMSWAVNQAPNEYFYETTMDTVVSIAPVEDCLVFFKQNPDVVYALLSRSYENTDTLLRRMKHLMKGTAQSRAILELLIACKCFEAQRNNACTVLVSENELAARTGLTRETISRELRQLQNRQLITMGRKQIIINDIASLEALLSQKL